MTQNVSPTPRQMWELLEPIHAVTYFSDVAVTAAAAVGYRGFWMGYFGCRLAPLGAIGPEIATAVCYGFSPARVARALPDAWTFASPDQALAARLAGATNALRRVGNDVREIEAAAHLAWEAAGHAAIEGRALGAANQALPRPIDPYGVIWQAATTLREHRGDGHNAALVAADITPVQAHLLKIATEETHPDTLKISRHWPEQDWERGSLELQQRGWLDQAERLTDTGRAAHDDIEERTDAAAASPWARLGADATARLAQVLAPLADAVVRAGIVPVRNPIGLDLGRVGP